jgi:hypothetical protein
MKDQMIELINQQKTYAVDLAKELDSQLDSTEDSIDADAVLIALAETNFQLVPIEGKKNIPLFVLMSAEGITYEQIIEMSK